MAIPDESKARGEIGNTNITIPDYLSTQVSNPQIASTAFQRYTKQTGVLKEDGVDAVSYTHLRAHET